MSMSPTVPSILSAIATVIKTAMNPGHPSRVTTVHTKRRFFRDPEKFNELFRRANNDSPTQPINGWLVYRQSTRPLEADERWRFYSIHRIRLEGFLAVADDTTLDQAAFDAQIEAIRDGLRLSTSVFGTMERTLPDSEVIEASTPILIGNVTAWHAVLGLEVQGVETKSL
jgi:hypothetical protein